MANITESDFADTENQVGSNQNPIESPAPPSSAELSPRKSSRNMASPTAATGHKAAPVAVFLGTLVFTLLSLPGGATSVPVEELDAALAALRSRGYNLAANAVAASDLRFDLLSAASLTLFAPVDSAVFALGMTVSAPDYLSALRSHAVPRRLSAADLRRIRSDAVVPTLLPSRTLRVAVSQHSNAVAVDGVELAVLGVFYGPGVAVHGLRGALSFRSQFGAINSSAPPPVPRRHSSSIFFRVPKFASPSSHENDRSSQPSVNLTDSLPPEPQESYSPSPEAPPYTAPEIQPSSVPLPAPAEMSSVAPMGKDGGDGDRRGRFRLPGDLGPTMMTPPFNGGGKPDGSLRISEPFDEETMSIEEVLEDDDEFWDEYPRLA